MKLNSDKMGRNVVRDRILSLSRSELKDEKKESFNILVEVVNRGANVNTVNECNRNLISWYPVGEIR